MCHALEWEYRKKQHLSQEAYGLGVHVRPDEEVSTREQERKEKRQ